MKILVSAYACDPYLGSEPGAGWSAVCRIARNHEVYVLTDDHNRRGWDQAKSENKIPENVQVRFLRKTEPCSSNRMVAQLQSWHRYRDFCRLALDASLHWHQEISFDLCHQVTIASWRLPSNLWKLPIPFVWGPLGGAGGMDKSFRTILSGRSRMFEAARDLSTRMAVGSCSFRRCMRHTSYVLAANQETYDFLLPYRCNSPMTILPIAVLDEERSDRFIKCGSRRAEGPLRLFAGGTMIGTKGVALALRALSEISKMGVDFHYTIAGGGPEIESLRSLAFSLGIGNNVTFHPGYSGDDYVKALHEHEVYLLPSFRETMGVTLIESVFAGMYPIVANRSAQAEIISIAGGTAAEGNTPDEMVASIVSALLWCNSNRANLQIVASEGTKRLLEHFSEDRYQQTIHTAYATALSMHHK